MTAPFLPWFARCLPQIDHAGAFPMHAPDCNQVYHHPTVALHLHDYAGEFWIGRHRFVLEAGDITLSPGEPGSRYQLPSGGMHLCVHFFREKGAEPIRLPLHLRLGPKTAAARERIWRVIDHARQQAGDSAAAGAASAALQETLLWLQLQSRRGRTARQHSLVEEALVKVRQNADAAIDRPVQVADLAAGCGLSADYVARLFAQRYGMSLQHYLLLRRMEQARHLLVSTDFPVGEVGRRAGLPDPQYFNKQFRRIAGVSPLAYRQGSRPPQPPARGNPRRSGSRPRRGAGDSR